MTNTERKTLLLDSYKAFKNEFATESEDRIRFGKPVTGRSKSFWTDAEMLGAFIDAYLKTKNSEILADIRKMFNTYFEDYGRAEYWCEKGHRYYNVYNDDIAWICIQLARFAIITNEKRYSDISALAFERTFARAWTDDFGGGLLWRDDMTTKNSCVNFPATISACLLYSIYGDEKKVKLGAQCKDAGREITYIEAATMMFDWAAEHLCFFKEGGEHYGKVCDSYDKGRITNYWSGTYNLGTCIGAGAMIYKLTGNADYLKKAIAAADYTLKSYEYGAVNGEANGNDLPGFKGILMRWLGYLKDELSDVADISAYKKWIEDNADSAYKNRNASGIMWTEWGKKTEDDMINAATPDAVGYTAWGCSSSIALLAAAID